MHKSLLVAASAVLMISATTLRGQATPPPGTDPATVPPAPAAAAPSDIPPAAQAAPAAPVPSDVRPPAPAASGAVAPRYPGPALSTSSNLEKLVADQILRQWHTNPVSCLEALREYSQNSEPAALERLERGQSLKARNIYDAEYADTGTRPQLWELLANSSKLSKLEDTSRAQAAIKSQLEVNAGSIHNAANIISATQTAAPTDDVKEATRVVSGIQNALLTWLSDSDPNQRSIDADSVLVTAAVTDKWTGLLGPAMSQAKAYAALLVSQKPFNAAQANADVNVADATLHWLDYYLKAPNSLLEGAFARMRAAALFELLYPQRANPRIMDLYRAWYRDNPDSFFSFVVTATESPKVL